MYLLWSIQCLHPNLLKNGPLSFVGFTDKLIILIRRYDKLTLIIKELKVTPDRLVTLVLQNLPSSKTDATTSSDLFRKKQLCVSYLYDNYSQQRNWFQCILNRSLRVYCLYPMKSAPLLERKFSVPFEYYLIRKQQHL